MRTLIVAKYNEDVAWTKDVPTGWRVMVVEKDKDLPNEGRESTSYLWAFNKLYKRTRPNDLIACVQGNPFDHCPDLFDRLQTTPTKYYPLGSFNVMCDAEGCPHHPGLPIAEKYEKWVGKPFPGSIEFTAGAQFIITGNDLLSYSQDYYKLLYNEVKDRQGPWIIERIWPSIWSVV